MTEDKDNKQLPIRELSKLTGVNSVTIRAWERRYGLLKPKRTEKGHRLYSQKDVELIQEIQRWLDKGIAIGKIKPLLSLAEDKKASAQETDNSEWDQAIEAISVAIETLNSNKLDSLLHQLMGNYPARVIWRYLIQSIDDLYMGTADTYGSASKKALWYQTLKAKTDHYLSSQAKELDKTALIIGLDGDNQSTEALFLARDLTESGIAADLKYFQIPVKEVLFAAEQTKADVILLVGNKSLTQQAIRTIQNLNDNQSAPVFVAGASSTLNSKQLKSAAINTASDHQTLIDSIKEALNNE